MVAVFLRLVEAQLFLLPANPLSTASKSSSGIAYKDPRSFAVHSSPTECAHRTSPACIVSPDSIPSLQFLEPKLKARLLTCDLYHAQGMLDRYKGRCPLNS